MICVTLTADGDVSAKIAEELAYEKEAAIESEPEFLKEFRTAGIWTVHFFFVFYCSVEKRLTLGSLSAGRYSWK